jgi:hypothetical protein
MNAKALTSVLAVGFGVFAVVLGIAELNGVLTGIARLPSLEGSISTSGLLWAIGWISVVPVGLIALGLVLVFRPPQRLFARVEALAGDSPASPPQSAAILTVGMSLIGVFLMVFAAPGVLRAVAVRVIALMTPEPPFVERGTLGDMIGGGVQLLFGIYLFFGAPGVCRWQMKRIEETSRDPAETDDVEIDENEGQEAEPPDAGETDADETGEDGPGEGG